jgi:hypothetical protein
VQEQQEEQPCGSSENTLAHAQAQPPPPQHAAPPQHPTPPHHATPDNSTPPQHVVAPPPQHADTLTWLLTYYC